jgi:hypothetical protein
MPTAAKSCQELGSASATPPDSRHVGDSRGEALHDAEFTPHFRALSARRDCRFRPTLAAARNGRGNAAAPVPVRPATSPAGAAGLSSTASFGPRFTLCESAHDFFPSSGKNMLRNGPLLTGAEAGWGCGRRLPGSGPGIGTCIAGRKKLGPSRNRGAKKRRPSLPGPRVFAAGKGARTLEGATAHHGSSQATVNPNESPPAHL